MRVPAGETCGVSAETPAGRGAAILAPLAALGLAALSLAPPLRAQPAMDASRVRADTFTYEVRFDGDPLGTLRVSYDRTEGGGLRLEEAVSGALGDEVTTAEVTRGLLPVSAGRRGRLARVEEGLELRYEGGRVTGHAHVQADSVPPGRGPGRTRRVEVDRELPSGVLDSNTLVAAILASPLVPGDTLRYPIFRPGRGVVRARARVSGTERVRVPAGAFRAFRVDLATDQGRFVLWVTRETPRILVRQRFRARPVEVVLEAVGADSSGAGGTATDSAGAGASAADTARGSGR